MITAEILTIGAELLQGKTLNTNSKFLSERLTDLGVRVLYHATCDDDIAVICSAFKTAFQRSDLVIVTGGLGPTPDDLTREAVAAFFQSELVFHRNQYEHVRRILKKLRKKISPAVKMEAMFPEVGVPLLNQFGIALGFYIKQAGKLMVVLPGVPSELENLFETKVKKVIFSHFGSPDNLHCLSVSMIGIGEAQMMDRLGKAFFAKKDFQFGSYPVEGRIILRFKAEKKTTILRVKKEISHKLKPFIYEFGEEPIENRIAQLLVQKRKTVATAESCTGGLVAKKITDIPGSSGFFLGGLVAYHNRIKENILSVDYKILSKYGAVSKQVASSMAAHIRAKFNSDYGISVTGIAGPGGGSAKKPVGLVWISIAEETREITHRFIFFGSRDRIRILAAERALFLFYQIISK